jgi:hypothetical protein
MSPLSFLADNLPYLAMVLLGAATIWTGAAAPGLWQVALAAGYAVYGVLGAAWIMIFVCPYCGFHGTTLCPCGYGYLSAKLRAKQCGSDFARQFKRHIPVIVPLWFLPLVAGGWALFCEFSWALAGLCAAFAVDAFVILPLMSKHYGCSACPQKDTCPWMGGRPKDPTA